MSYKIFEIAGAMDNEVDDIRMLLAKNNVNYYETPRAEFGISVTAIWVYDKESHSKARLIIEKYQEKLRLESRKNNTEQTEANSFGLYILAIFIFLIAMWGIVYDVSLY